jgi:hypothetical protein
MKQLSQTEIYHVAGGTLRETLEELGNKVYTAGQWVYQHPQLTVCLTMMYTAHVLVEVTDMLGLAPCDSNDDLCFAQAMYEAMGA